MIGDKNFPECIKFYLIIQLLTIMRVVWEKVILSKGVLGMVKQSLLSALAVLLATAAPVMASETDVSTFVFTDSVVTEKGTYDAATLNSSFQTYLKSQAAQKAKLEAVAQRTAAANLKQAEMTNILKQYSTQKALLATMEQTNPDYAIVKGQVDQLMGAYYNVTGTSAPTAAANTTATKVAAAQQRAAAAKLSFAAQQEAAALAKQTSGVTTAVAAVKTAVSLEKTVSNIKTPQDILKAINQTSKLVTLKDKAVAGLASAATVQHAGGIPVPGTAASVTSYDTFMAAVDPTAMATYNQYAGSVMALAAVPGTAASLDPTKAVTAAATSAAKSVVYKNGFGLTADQIVKNNTAQLKSYQDIASNFLKTLNSVSSTVNKVSSTASKLKSYF
jgi:hypothetical protein